MEITAQSSAASVASPIDALMVVDKTAASQIFTQPLKHRASIATAFGDEVVQDLQRRTSVPFSHLRCAGRSRPPVVYCQRYITRWCRNID